jgi:DNA polymerase-3 subunit alpha
MEAYVTGVTGDTSHEDKTKRENFHLVLLAENNIGNDNLKKLSTRAFTHGKYYFPRIDKGLLREHSEGLIALTACLGGEVGKKAANGDRDGARLAAHRQRGREQTQASQRQAERVAAAAAARCVRRCNVQASADG